MISIGNDIVDLSATNRERTGNTRFYSKFITPAELALYQSQAVAAIPFDTFVWLLWSVKESAYKYLQRLNPQLIFSPINIIVHDLQIPAGYPVKILTDNMLELQADAQNGIIGTIPGPQTLYFKSVIDADLVATIISDDPWFKNIVWGIRQIADSDQQTQSRLVREFILNKVKDIFPQGNLTIHKSDTRYPVLLNNGVNTGIPVSFAHHGRYVSYCFKH